jgi:hypothetical protein
VQLAIVRMKWRRVCSRSAEAVDKACTQGTDLGLVKRVQPLIAELTERHPSDVAPIEYQTLHHGGPTPPLRHLVCRVLVNDRCASVNQCCCMSSAC